MEVTVDFLPKEISRRERGLGTSIRRENPVFGRRTSDRTGGSLPSPEPRHDLRIIRETCGTVDYLSS